MKNHPAWLAAGLLLFAVLACSTSTSTGPISDLHMAKDNGNEQPGAETKTFRPGDRTVHCVAKLNEAKDGTSSILPGGQWMLKGRRTRNSGTWTTPRKAKRTSFMLT